MIKIYCVLCAFFCTYTLPKKSNCELAYSTATYALMHAKKALKANNFDHQKYASSKALASYEKIVEYLTDCKCDNLSDKVAENIEDAKKASDPVDWDRGRYYSKKVYNSTQDLIGLMDECFSAEPEASK
ncbi:hypothetical protein SAMN04487911_109103 [Arenibacter nanhaiticus]|uniref:Uncharacterized protein n=1 Tax=Arenibacter nanhaiticus TaxID=558155 RepID=A0A1M6FVV0_9FLAO|nr:hypothetical protein [Arenibacter nanhaiticus]SHJ01828.1 hypothetical protein SAMN04487911_109103 [Arenibacter nanhaiticus]